MDILDKRQNETTREFAIRNLKHNIINLNLYPGYQMSANDLAMEMGLSKTPVREALNELSHVDIVEIYPQKGSCVAKIDYDLVEEARFIRYTLESAIVTSACDIADQVDLTPLEENIKLQEFYFQNGNLTKLLELDNAFHQAIFQLVNKSRTYKLMDSMLIHFDRVRSMSLSSVKEIKIVADHKAILTAIQKKDKEKAKEVMLKHLNRYKIDKEYIEEKYPEYFKVDNDRY